MNTKVPNVFECTYLRKDYFKFPPSKNITPIPDPTLDSKNVLHNPEINLSEYPFVKS